LSRGGARVFGPVNQRDFLVSLGIGPRTDRLAQDAPADEARNIRTATERLIAPDRMGELFKVMVAAHGDSPTLAGFET
jgi:NADH dehydrogenase [ubiquinone] 1 alpha subcomplex assembly factor 7